VKDSVAGRLGDFVVGMAIVRVYSRLRSRAPSETALLSALGLGLATIYLTAACWDAVRLQSLDHAVVPFTNNIFQFGCFVSIPPLLLMRGRLVVLVANPVLQILGMMCYSLYVWHGVTRLQMIGGSYTAVRLGTYFAAVLAISALSYRYVEFGHVLDGRSLFRVARVDS
jgi:peptidoglycan/LPS O-acetylase OafA/YrhL